MTTVFKISDPDGVQCSMTIAMSLADWKRLQTQLNASDNRTSFPAWKLIRDIDALVSKANMEFGGEPTPKEQVNL